MGSEIVPAVMDTPTTVGVLLRANEAKGVFAVAREEATTTPAPRVKDATADPLQADEVAEVPNPATVAVPVPLQVNFTVNTLLPLPVNATFVTEILPDAKVRVTAGASWTSKALPFTKNPVLKFSVEGPWFLTNTVTGKLVVLLETTA